MTDTTTERPVPQRPLPAFPEPDTADWWKATKEHRLLYQVSKTTGGIVFFPRRHSIHSLDLEMEWRESTGAGTIYTFTVMRQHGHPFFRNRLPYVIALVDLDEGFRMLGEIDADPTTVHIGQQVRLTWEDHADVSIPLFTPLPPA